MNQTKREHIILVDMLLIAVAFCCFSISLFTSVLGLLNLALFIFAMVLLPVGLFDVCRVAFGLHLFSSKNLKDDKQGLAWIWIVGFFLTIPMCALIYFVLDYPFDIIVETVLPIYTYTGFMASAMTAVEVIIDYLLAFVVIFAVLWVVINAKSPQGGYY